MSRRITNISTGGVVGIQCGTSSTDDHDDVEVTNINDGGTVGVQGDNVSGVTVVINGETVVR